MLVLTSIVTVVILGTTTVSSSAGTCRDSLIVDALPPLPIAVSNNAVTSVDYGDGTYAIYSFMGITDPASSASITAASFRFEGPGGPWVAITDAPRLGGRAKIGANAITVGGAVYLIGGYSVAGFSETTEPRLFRYDPEGDGYVELASVPVEVDDTVVGAYEDRYLYLVSGWHGPLSRNVPNVQVYDTRTNEWDQATPIPAPLPGLFGHAGGLVGDRLVYMDGVRSIAGFPISGRVFVGAIDPDATGDVLTIAWEEIDAHPGLPTYRAAPGLAGTPRGQLLVVGGTDNPYNFSGTGYDGNPSNPLEQTFALDPVTGTSESLDVLGNGWIPTMDHRGLAPIPGGGWVTVGGMTAPGMTTDLVQRYTFVAAVNGDVNCDGVVDFTDVLSVLSAWGPCLGCAADVNGDGVVDFVDLLTVLSAWTP